MSEDRIPIYQWLKLKLKGTQFKQSNISHYNLHILTETVCYKTSCIYLIGTMYNFSENAPIIQQMS